jgi:DNA-binding winged helix-turn-helix (wHTH) protein
MPLFGQYELDEARRTLSLSGTRVPLQPRVFDLLAYLIRHRERAVPHDEILKQVWSGVAVAKSVLPVAIWKLRQALAADAAAECIETVHGYGFRFSGEVEVRRVLPPHDSTTGSAWHTPGITVLVPRLLAGASSDLTVLTSEELLVQLHRQRVLPVLAAEFVTNGAGRLLESARGSKVRYALIPYVNRTVVGSTASARLTDVRTLWMVWSTLVTTVETDPVSAARTLSAQIVASLWTALMFERVAYRDPASKQDPWAPCVPGTEKRLCPS